jgi:hypothetical protein
MDVGSSSEEPSEQKCWATVTRHHPPASVPDAARANVGPLCYASQ